MCEQTSAPFLPPAQLRRLTRALDTPFYLYDEKSLLANAQALFTSFSWNPGFREYMPLRRCKNPALLRLLRGAGCGALCTDLAQLQLAEACGFSGEQLLYAPLRRHDAAGALAFRLDATWVLDGVYVLPPLPPERVILRWNPGGKLRADGRTLANFDRIKSGMRDQEILDMVCRFAAQNTSIGLMLSACGNCLDPGYYPAVAEALFTMAVKIREQSGVMISSCNLSGGFGVSSRPGYASPELKTAAENIHALFDAVLVPAGLGGVQLQTALDRYLLCSAGVLVTSVMALREREMPTCIVDAAFEQSVLLGNYHPISALACRPKSEPGLFCVAGCQDVLRGGLGEGCVLPQLRPGDRLLVHMAGFDEIPGDTPVYLLRATGALEPV